MDGFRLYGIVDEGADKSRQADEKASMLIFANF